MKFSYLKRKLPHEIDYFPFILDFDFEKMRPRGGSACMDFFTFGKITQAVEEVGAAKLVYVRKAGLFPADGFFLSDFSHIVKDSTAFKEQLKKLNVRRVYLEESAKFPLEPVFDETAEELKIVFVRFES